MWTGLTALVERAALRTVAGGTPRLLGALSPGWLASLQRARFQRTLRLAAAQSPFYAEQFHHRRIDVRRIEHPAQLGDFYTTSADLRRHGAEAFLIGRADTAFETTGTTSSVPTRMFFSHRELEAMGRTGAAGLQHLLGVRREDIVVSAFDSSFWVSPAVARVALQYVGCFHVEAGKIDPLEFYTRACRYRPTVMLGEPSWLVRLSELAEARGTWPVKLLIAGGEPVADASRRTIERVWHAPLYVNYGQTEAFGSLGVECRVHDGYHRNDLHFLFEIADAGEDGMGELVYTTLTRDVMPLIRYRSGDVTRLVEEPCACGFGARRIGRIRGRADEMVVCGMGNIGPWVFTEILRGVPGADDEWQAVVTHDGLRDVIELKVEVDSAVDRADVERVTLDNLRERFPDFWRNRAMSLYELRVTTAPRGTLRRARKLRRVVDQRLPAG